MPPHRHFLGWEHPLCETVPAWLLAECAPGTLDLRDTVVVVPTRQASWRLRADLPLAAHVRGLALLGPEIVTAPALLHPPPDARRASDLQLLLAWRAALRALPAGALAALLGRRRPDTAAWALQIGRRLSSLRAELADGALAIADVAGRGAAIEEAERWAALADLERRCLDRLAAWNLRDPVADQLEHARTGRLPAGVRRVVLAAMPDPPQLLLTLLEQARDARVDVLVAAPEAEAAAFDAWGRPLPDAWAERPIPVADADLLLAANPEEQAGRIAAAIAAGLPHDFQAPEAAATRLRQGSGGHAPLRPSLAIGVPDRESVAPLQRELAGLGLPAFDPQNRPFADTPLFRLVQALLAWRDRPGYAETAALLRHPDVLAARPDPGRVLAQLDETQSAHLPVAFADLRQRADGELRAALDRLDAWRAPLAGPALSAGLRAVLRGIFDARQLSPGDPHDAAFLLAAGALDDALRELAAAEEAGHAGEDAAAALLARLQAAALKPERAGEPLDLEGWLELAWNPAPVLFVAGLNEGLVPDTRVSDMFLPDSLRRELDLRDDRRRVARDAYVLAALLAQRRRDGRVTLLVGKTSGAGDPLRPSRLLFRCPDDRLVARSRRLFASPPPGRPTAAFEVSFLLDPSGIRPGSGESRAEGAETAEKETSIPQRSPRPPREPDAILGSGLRLSATKFRDYLACPLRFYLRHVLGMEAANDRSREPDAAAFGTLVHAALDAMSREGLWACGDAARLADWLERQVRAAAAEQFGARPWLGVTLAVESAVRRLRVFAARQVAWHADGWEIVAAECAGLALDLDGTTVSGRIDRVDRNRRDGRVCVLDYKTTDAAKPPAQTHLAAASDHEPLLEAVVPAAAAGTRRDRRWIDLQLPLYREMVRPLHGPGVRTGYILLPATLADTGFVLWSEYSDELHASALACARAVAARIRAGVFWPPSGRPVPYDDFGDLLFDDAERFMRPVAARDGRTEERRDGNRRRP
jgi:ATP-dependent helicase/nuclease subunit B